MVLIRANNALEPLQRFSKTITIKYPVIGYHFFLTKGNNINHLIIKKYCLLKIN